MARQAEVRYCSADILLLFYPLQACSKVVRALNIHVKSMRSSLDGQNVEIAMTELGKRFHRMVYEHILGFQYNSIGQYLEDGPGCQATVYILGFHCNSTGQ